jgi:5'(3')-deoxyribonucleotidase
MAFDGQAPAAPVPAGTIDPSAIAFDVDGVIADTMGLFLDIAREEFGIHGIRYDDIRCYNLEDCLDLDPGVIDAVIARIMAGGYRAALRPIPGAAGVLGRLASCSGAVLCVTARPHIGPVGDFMRSLLPGKTGRVEIVATGSFDAKTEVLLDRNITHFVEDRLETCFSLNAAGIHPVLYVQPWNRQPHPFVEVSSWRAIDELIQW